MPPTPVHLYRKTVFMVNLVHLKGADPPFGGEPCKARQYHAGLEPQVQLGGLAHDGSGRRHRRVLLVGACMSRACERRLAVLLMPLGYKWAQFPCRLRCLLTMRFGAVVLYQAGNKNLSVRGAHKTAGGFADLLSGNSTLGGLKTSFECL